MATAHTGTLILRKKGYVVRVTEEREGETIKPYYELGTFDPLVAARKQARLLERLDKGETVEETETVQEETVEDCAKDFFEKRISGQVTVSAKAEKRTFETYALPIIGKLRLSEVRSKHIDAILEKAKELGRKRASLHNLRTSVCQLFRRAVREELIMVNPALGVLLPKTRELKKERAILTDAEFIQYLTSPRGDLELNVWPSAPEPKGVCGLRTCISGTGP